MAKTQEWARMKTPASLVRESPAYTGYDIVRYIEICLLVCINSGSCLTSDERSETEKKCPRDNRIVLDKKSVIGRRPATMQVKIKI